MRLWLIRIVQILPFVFNWFQDFLDIPDFAEGRLAPTTSLQEMSVVYRIKCHVA